MSNAWKCFRLVLEAKAPVHIGWHELGTIQRTRYYIHSRSVWGAVVSAYATRLFADLGVPAKYARAETRLNGAMSFTCFFPAPSPDEATVLRPRYDGEGLRLGNLERYQFEHQYVTSQTSAALLPDNLAAEEGALHESEYLAPVRAPARLFFIGYIFTRDAELESRLNICTQHLWFGADRRYGWGHLVRIGPPERVDRFFDTFAIEDRNQLQVRVEQAPAFLPSHLKAGDGTTVCGDLEVLCGREWAHQGSGRKIAEPLLCWAPGSRLEASGATFQIDSKGVWHPPD